MEFEEFAAKFRERTASRMLEFEAALERIQQDVEKKAALDAEREGEKQDAARAGRNQAGAASAGPREGVTSSSSAGRVPRPVRSVLRRG